MEQKSEGICRFCLKTYSGASMGRHLLACKKKKEQDKHIADKSSKNYRIFHLKINAGKYYWLHVEISAASKLLELDSFLRSIWLECCGHLSAFSIDGFEYEENPGDDFWDIKETRPLTTKIYNALGVGDTFDYEYDFGSTTYLTGKVLDERTGTLTNTIQILARNNPYTFECDECGEKAEHLCIECETFICEKCSKEHECGEEMFMPVVNSPRMGVCGYWGESDYDNFYEQYIKEK